LDITGGFAGAGDIAGQTFVDAAPVAFDADSNFAGAGSLLIAAAVNLEAVGAMAAAGDILKVAVHGLPASSGRIAKGSSGRTSRISVGTVHRA
jgi:hypothetical protein